MAGGFVISLDFELMWGVRDKKTIESYGNEIMAVHQILPRMLKMFRQYNVKATFATVGFLFAETQDDIKATIPTQLPNYTNPKLSPYQDVSEKQENISDPYYFCYSLLQSIAKDYPEQEIGTHTYSHYYCLEEGQTIQDFEAELDAAIAIANRKNLPIKSIVFPRNQVNQSYLEVCKKKGIKSYRGVENAWYYASQANQEETKIKRAFRLMDTYINLSGHNTFVPQNIDGIVDVPSSRFFRPYSKKLSFLESLKCKRIKNGLSYAAKNNQYFHLWWHPHNFGNQTDEMFDQLEDILQHFQNLSNKHDFHSYTMGEIAEAVL